MSAPDRDGAEWRVRNVLDPLLSLDDPRERISAYHDMPYALFRYDPDEELTLRAEVTLLETRLSEKGKRVTRISLAECLQEALVADRPLPEWFEAERQLGSDTLVETIHSVISSYHVLDDLVARRMPKNADPRRDVVFILRAGALFPAYRTSALLEQLKGRIHAPTILFYPGTLDGAAGLQFMGVLDSDPNYRPKIF